MPRVPPVKKTWGWVPNHQLTTFYTLQHGSLFPFLLLRMDLRASFSSVWRGNTVLGLLKNKLPKPGVPFSRKVPEILNKKICSWPWQSSSKALLCLAAVVCLDQIQVSIRVNSPSELSQRPSCNSEWPKAQSQAQILLKGPRLQGLTIFLRIFRAGCTYQSISNPLPHLLLTILVNNFVWRNES